MTALLALRIIGRRPVPEFIPERALALGMCRRYRALPCRLFHRGASDQSLTKHLRNRCAGASG
jgi:hypothetical protein